MENNTIVTLKPGEGRSFKAGGLWIYDNEIASIKGTFKNGAVVAVQEQTATRSAAASSTRTRRSACA